MKEYTVLVRCMTYNQSKYILDTLNGFVMQKTNFPFVCLVMDDASTDGEQQVIKDFLGKECAMDSAEFSEIEEADVVVVPHKTNQNCTMAVYFLKKNLYGTNKKNPLITPWQECCKYEALCEGDDYWTDPTKLQQQVDILSADEGLMGVVTDTAVVDGLGNVLAEKRGRVIPSNKEGRYNIHDFFREPTHKYPTASVMYRSTHREEIARMKAYTANPFLGDWTLWIILHTFGDFYYIDKPMVAYRINPTSVTHTEDKVARAIAGPEICAKVADILPPDCEYIAKRLRRKKRAKWVSLAHAYLDGHQYLKGIGCALLSVFVCPRALYITIKRVIDWKTGKRSEYI